MYLCTRIYNIRVLYIYIYIYMFTVLERCMILKTVCAFSFSRYYSIRFFCSKSLNWILRNKPSKKVIKIKWNTVVIYFYQECTPSGVPLKTLWHNTSSYLFRVYVLIWFETIQSERWVWLLITVNWRMISRQKCMPR